MQATHAARAAVALLLLLALCATAVSAALPAAPPAAPSSSSSSPLLQLFVVEKAILPDFVSVLLQARQALSLPSGNSGAPIAPFAPLPYSTLNLTAGPAQTDAALGSAASVGITVQTGTDVCRGHPLLCDACARPNDHNLRLLPGADSAVLRSRTSGSEANDTLSVEEDFSVWGLLECVAIWGTDACNAHRSEGVAARVLTAADLTAARLTPSLQRPLLSTLANLNDSHTPMYLSLPRMCSCTTDCHGVTPTFELASVEVLAGCRNTFILLNFTHPAQRTYPLAHAARHPVALSSVIAAKYVPALLSAAGVRAPAMDAEVQAVWVAESTLAIILHPDAALTPAQALGVRTRFSFTREPSLAFLNSGSSVPADFLVPQSPSLRASNRPSVAASVPSSGAPSTFTVPAPVNPCVTFAPDNFTLACGSAGQAVCTVGTAEQARCLPWALALPHTCVCRAPWTGPECGSSGTAPVKADVSLRLALDFATLDARALARDLCATVATALSVPSWRVLLMRVQAGSVIATLRLLSDASAGAPSTMQLLSVLRAQVSDPRSPLRNTTLGATVDPSFTPQATLFVQCAEGRWATSCEPGATPASDDAEAIGFVSAGVQREDESGGGLRPWAKGVIAACVIGAVIIAACVAYCIISHRRREAKKNAAGSDALGEQELPLAAGRRAVSPLPANLGGGADAGIELTSVLPQAQVAEVDDETGEMHIKIR